MLLKQKIKKEYIFILVGAIIFFIGVFLVVKSIFFDSNNLLNVYILSSDNEVSGCRSIYADYNGEEVVEYSFDEGKSWKKSNLSIVCTNGTKKVLVRNESKEIISSGNIKINDLIDNYPKIEIDFDNEIYILNENAILMGVKAFDKDGKDITDRIVIEVKLSDDNESIIIRYSVLDDFGNKTIVERNVSSSFVENSSSINSYPIFYAKQNYSCKEGETITTSISVEFSGLVPSYDFEIFEKPIVKSYKSSNTDIATIEKHPTINSQNSNSENVLIKCLKTGNVVLSAISNLGATTISEVNVTNKIVDGKVSFDRNSYDVGYGKTINIKFYGANINDLDFKVKDSKIINVEVVDSNTSGATLKVHGLKVGTTTLEVLNKNNEKIVTTVVVKDCSMEFGSNSYQLFTGMRTIGTITSNYIDGSKCNIKSVKSSDPKIVSILNEDEEKNVISDFDNFRFFMNPLKEGKVTLTATCETGKEITSTVIVKDKKITKFTSSNYELNVGENLYITITSFLGNGQKDEIVDVKIDSSDVVTAKLNGYNAKYSRYGVTLTGVKAGTTSVTAVTKSGATATAYVIVSEKEKGSISFNKSVYTCNVGQKITAYITANHIKENDVMVKSYASSDSSIATIVKHPSLIMKNSNSIAVQINCLKNGEVDLVAISNLGATTSSKLICKNEIQFEKQAYSVDVGKVLKVKLINIKDKEIKVVAKDSSLIKVNNISYSKENNNEGYVEIKGLKSGITTLVMTDDEGNKTLASINVKVCNINFEAASYKLVEEESLLAGVISQYSDGKSCKITSITSSNTKVVTINYDNKTPDSSGKHLFYINAKSKGEATLTATCETGNQKTVVVKVDPKIVQYTSLIKESDFLITNGTKIVKKGTGQQVVLRGYNIGQWMSRGIHALPISAAYNVEKKVSEGGTRYSDNNDIEIDYELFTNVNNFSYDEVMTLNNAFYNNYISEEDARLISATGSNAVRIAIGYTFFMKPVFKNNELTYVLDKDFIEERLDLLEEKVDMFANYGIYSIIDMHLGPGNSMSGGYRETIGFFYGDSEHTASYYQQIVLDIWKYIAIRFKDHPAIAGYDLINEPGITSDGDFKKLVLPFYEKAYNVIRAQDKNHIVIMQARFRFYYNWENGWVMPKPEEKGWKNVVYSIHEYHLDNGEQGLCGNNPRWCKLEDYYKRIAKGDYQNVSVYIDRLKYTSDISIKNMKEYNVPLYVGEFNLADLAADTDYVWGYMMDIYNTNNISYTAWTYKTGWEAYDGIVYYGRKGFVMNSQKGKVDLKKATYTDIMNAFNPCSIPSIKNESKSSSNAIMNFNTRFYEIFKKHTQTISLNTNNFKINVGSTKQITATIKPAGAKYNKITWTSSNTNVAIVDSNGKVTALSQGNVTISAKTENGTISTCYVTVEVPASVNVKRIGPFTDNVLFSKIKSQLQSKNVNYKSDDVNKIIEIPNSDIIKITKLDLSSQPNSTQKIENLTGIGSFTVLTSLISLNLSNNNLEYNDIEEIGKLTNLIELNLGSNNIGKTIPGAIGNLVNLKALYLSNNKISKVTSTSTIVKLKNLNTLTMKNNQIEDASGLDSLSKLQNNSTTTNFQEQKIIISTTSSTIELPNIFINEKIGASQNIVAYNNVEIIGNASISSDKTKLVINQKGSGIVTLTLKGGVFNNSTLVVNYDIK